AIMVARDGPPEEVMINCLVNNVTNLTLLLGLPALFWGLVVIPRNVKSGVAGKKAVKSIRSTKDTGMAGQLNRLSLLLTLAAVVFFSGATWALGRDGQLDQTDGLI